MSKTNRRVLNQILAIILTILMIVAMVPAAAFQTAAATDKYTDKYTVTVKCGEYLIEGVNVTFNRDGEVFAVATTDGDGVAGFDLSELGKEFENNEDLSEIKLSLSAEKSGYKSIINQEVSITESNLTDNLDLTIEELPTYELKVKVDNNINVKINNELKTPGEDGQVVLSFKQGDKVTLNLSAKENYLIDTLKLNQDTTVVNKKEITKEITINNSDVVAEVSSKVEQANITVNNGVGGNVKVKGSNPDQIFTVNSNDQSTLSIDKGSNVTVEVDAKDGYYISAVEIDGTKYEENLTTTFIKDNITVKNDFSISVSYIRVYTVSVKYDNAQGSVSVNDEIVDSEFNKYGDVIVKKGKDVTVYATANENYRIASVVTRYVENSEKKTDKVYFDSNDKNTYENTINDIASDYEFDIVFALDRYGVEVLSDNNGKVEAYPSLVDRDSSSQITVTPKFGYTVDEIKVGNKVLKGDELECDGSNVVFTVENIIDTVKVNVKFKEASPASYDEVNFTTGENEILKQVDSLYIMKRVFGAVFKSNNGNDIVLYDKNGNVIGGGRNKTSVTISSNNEVAKIGFYYQAEGDLLPCWHYIDASYKFVIDTNKPTVTVDPNKFGCYCDDFTFKMVIKDDGQFDSGISYYEYEIIKDGDTTTKTYREECGKSSEIIRDITVNAAENDSNFVEIVIRVFDANDNWDTLTGELSFNTTAPQVELSIDGVESASGDEQYYADKGFFNVDRTITIKIQDKSYTFNPENATKGLNIIKDGKTIELPDNAINWTSEGDLHIGKYKLTEDGVYDVSYQYKNAASSTSNKAQLETFTIDKTAADNFSVEIKNSFGEILLEAITFGFYKAPVTVTVKAEDSLSGIKTLFYYYDVEESSSDVNKGGNGFVNITPEYNKSASYSFKIDPQFRGKVTVEALDRAGNLSSYTDGRTVVVDNIAPGVSIIFDNDEAHNETFYNNDRVATVRIDEANFSREDADGVLLKIKTLEKYFDGSESVERWVRSDYEEDESLFTENIIGGKTYYETQIKCERDANYQITVEYTDRSGNFTEVATGDEPQSYAVSEFTIDKTPPVMKVSFEEENSGSSDIFNTDRHLLVEVTDYNFSAEDVVVDILNGSVVDENIVKFFQDEGNWSTPDENGTRRAKYTLAQGFYAVSNVKCYDLAGNLNQNVLFENIPNEDFIIDKENPSDLKVEYIPDFVAQLVEGLTFGFYNASVTVKISAKDMVSGIASFKYWLSTGSNGDITIDKEDIKDEGNSVYSATFKIDPEFRGKVGFEAIDNSGNKTEHNYSEDTETVVVDSIAPGISIEYKDNNVSKRDNGYYAHNRTATIFIEESNFFQQDVSDGLLTVVVESTSDEGVPSVSKYKPQFEFDEGKYSAEILFLYNADYKITVNYTDRSGNTASVVDEFTIDKQAPEIEIKAEDGTSLKNTPYCHDNKKIKLVVKEHNFDPKDVDLDVVGTDVNGKNYTQYGTVLDWATVDEVGNIWESVFELEDEGNYSIGLNYTDKAGSSSGFLNETICIDKNAPDDLTIEYTPDFVSVLLNAITFGFYQGNVDVRVSAKEKISGVQSIQYSYGGNTFTVNGQDIKVVDLGDDGNEYYTTFEIPVQFRGVVSFTVTDKSGLKDTLVDNRTVVADTVPPEVDVTFDDGDHTSDKFYYNEDRKATITITEANFFPKDDLEDGNLTITVTEKSKEKADDSVVTVLDDLVFEYLGNNVYATEIEFNKNSYYKLDVSYTDRSGNGPIEFSDDFVIDKISPVVNVTYTEDDRLNAERKATITVTEHNFDPKDLANGIINGLDINVSVENEGSFEEVVSYREYLSELSNWHNNGDVYTISFKFTDDFHYNFSVDYVDPAGNVCNDDVFANGSKTEDFYLDKEQPKDTNIMIGDTSILFNGSIKDIKFNKFYYKDTVNVKILADTGLSGTESIMYQMVDKVEDYVPDNDGVNHSSKLEENLNWKKYNSEGITVDPSAQFILFVRVIEKSGNVAYFHSAGVIVDDKKPGGESYAPDININFPERNENGIYTEDVTLGIKVVDPKYVGTVQSDDGYSSGLKSIAYEIYTDDTKASKTETLLNLKSENENDLTYSFDGEIKIDAKTFNSDTVQVMIKAVDNAGNIRETITKLGDIKIDVTAPKIEVKYDNNSVDSGSHFKAGRTAEVVVTERNFRPEDVIIKAINTDGAAPEIGEWKKTEGSGNRDNTKWTNTITFGSDGDYEFDIEYTDLAGHKCAGDLVQYGTSVACNKFTIDTIKPTVAVTYNNNNSRNQNYYDASRTATVVITEHNLEPNGVDKGRVQISLTATDDGRNINLPVVSSWRTVGDTHTATINYSADGFYGFDIAIKDKAGNDSADFVKQEFYVDTTAPELKITGVENHSANNGDVAPIVTYSDTNYDANQVNITLTGAMRNGVALEGSYSDIHNGRVFSFYNFEKVEEVDDIYTLTATITDKAGNSTSETITFSVNRFGSTYALDDATKTLNGTYTRTPVDVVISETNTNELSDIVVTLFKTSETQVLTLNKDYKIEVAGGNGSWYHYKYTIFAKNFEQDGVYTVTVESKDAAGNEAKNNLDTKNVGVSFGIDNTLPVINVENLESKKTYAFEKYTVNMSVNDNLKLSKVIVELDGAVLAQWTDDELEEIVKAGGNFSFEIPGDTTSSHKLLVYAIDAAGNGEKIGEVDTPENMEVIEDFFITTNLWIRYYNNKLLFFGTIGGVILLAGFIIFLVIMKRRKNEK